MPLYTTSFPGSLIFIFKMRDPGKEVALYIELWTEEIFPPAESAESWLVNSNFRRGSHMQGAFCKNIFRKANHSTENFGWKFPARNFRNFGYTSRCCPLYWKIIFHSSLKISWNAIRNFCSSGKYPETSGHRKTLWGDIDLLWAVLCYKCLKAW